MMAGEMLVLTTSADEYMDKIAAGDNHMQINVMATVQETKQMYVAQDGFRLRTIIPNLIPVSCLPSITAF